jgi:NADH-quinone oxidoreductase subunit A
MPDSPLHAYGPLLIHMLIAGFIAGIILSLSVLVGFRKRTRAKQEAYECGIRPTGDAREPFSVKFYLVAMIFILFDVEMIFLFPWAYIFRELKWFGLAEMVMFIGIVFIGYIYLWKKGALDWNR